jgi:tetratricopeptide (TPR) repeat protein
MKRRGNFLLIAIFLLLFVAICFAWAPITPDIYNRGYFHYRKGEEFFQEGEYQDAIEELDKAYEYTFDRKKKLLILKKKVIALMYLEEFESAIRVIEGIDYKGGFESEFLSLKVECLQRVGRTDEAIGVLHLLVKGEKVAENRVAFLIKEGLLYLSLDSLARAEEMFYDAFTILQEEGIVTGRYYRELTLYSLGYIYLRTEEYERAEKYLEILSTEYTDDEVGFKSLLYLAFISGIEGEEIRAEDILNTITAKGESEVSVMRGYLLYRNGSFEEARKEFEFARNDTFLDPSLQRMNILLLAECSYQEKSYGEAVEYYKEYIDLITDAERKQVALYGLAWSYFRLSKYSNAYAVLKDFLVLYPDSPFLYEVEKLAALSLFYVGEHERAKYHFTRLLSLDNEIQEKDRIYYLRGKSEFYLREYDEAKKDFERIVNYFPTSRWKPHAMSMIGRVYFENGEYAEAYKIYKEILILELSPSLLDEVHFQTERCLLHLGYYSNPIEMSKMFVRKYPESPKSIDLQLEVAEYYFQLQKYWDAIREYERFLNLYPTDKNERFVLYKLARSYSYIGYHKKANGYYRELSVGDDEFAESALISLGDFFFSNKQYKESIETYKELTRRFPESTMKDYANFTIGKNYLELNLPKEARVSFELVVNSKRIFRFKEKAKLLLAKTLYMEGKGEEYLVYLDNLIKTGTQEIRAESYFLKAKYKKETGRFKKALDFFKKAAEEYAENSDKVRALFEAGLVAEELMLFDEALKIYTEALDLSPLDVDRQRLEERIRRIEMIKREN